MADIDDRWTRLNRSTGKREHTTRYGTSKRWVARWREPSGQQRSRAIAKRSDAEKFLSTVRADLLRGVWIDDRAGRITLRQYVEKQWLPVQHHLRPNTVDLFTAHLRNHILPLLGDRAIGTLRRADMKGFVATLSTRLAAATAHTVYAILRAIMSSAVDDEVIPGSPCSRVPLPRINPRVITPLSADQVRSLAEAITPRYEITVWLAAAALGWDFAAIAAGRRHRRMCPERRRAVADRPWYVPIDDVRDQRHGPRRHGPAHRVDH